MDMRSLRPRLPSRTVFGVVAAFVALLIVGAITKEQRHSGAHDDGMTLDSVAIRPAMASTAAMPAAAAPAMAGAPAPARAASDRIAEASVFQSTAKGSDASRLIRTAQLDIQVTNIVRAMSLADSIARLRDAVVTDSRSNEAPDSPRDANFVVRVPAVRFSETLMALRGIGDVRSETIGTQDVTRAYTDLEARIAVQRETVSRLRALLADRTGKLSDVLEVERELSRTVAELEQMEGEQRYYAAQVAVSSITVHIYEQPPIVRTTLADPIAEAARSAVAVLSSSVALVVFGATFLAPWAVLAGAGWWLVRRYAIWTGRA